MFYSSYEQKMYNLRTNRFSYDQNAKSYEFGRKLEGVEVLSF